MPPAPRPASVPKIPGALKFYVVMSYITGTFLILLLIEMILKYSIDASTGAFVLPSTYIIPETGKWAFYEPGFEVELAGEQGFLALVPAGETTAVNLSIGILIIHGWLYVIYLFAGFRLWTLMRWSLPRFIMIALGGIIPGLSFILENIYAKQVKAFLKTSTPAPGGQAA